MTAPSNTTPASGLNKTGAKKGRGKSKKKKETISGHGSSTSKQHRRMKSQDSNGANLKAKTGNLGNNLNEPVEEEDDEDLEDGAPN